MEIEWNEEAWQQLADQITAVHRDLVERFEGHDVEAIKTALTAAYADRDWTVSDPELTVYAKAISRGEIIEARPDLPD